MNEIPTTEQVRHGYSIVDGGLNDPWIRGDAEKRFDRWLAEVKAQDRERIIALLEAEFYEDGVNMNTMLVSYGLVIALIKGQEQ